MSIFGAKNYATLSDIVRPHLHVLFWWKLNNLLRSLRSLRTDIDDTHTEPNMDIFTRQSIMTRRWGYRLPPADAPMSAINISKFSQAKLVAKLPTWDLMQIKIY